MKKYILFLCMLVPTLAVQAQKKVSLSPHEEEEMMRVARQIVGSFQESCKRIGKKDINYDEKVCKNGIIDRAMKDVLDDRKDKKGSNIQITSLDGKRVSVKPIRQYLLNLAGLSKKYLSIRIETTQIAAAQDFKEDPNRPGWFVGEVTCTQRFSAALKAAERPVYIKDKVERTFKIYVRRVEYREKNRKRMQWQVKIHHITAKNLPY